MKILYNKISEKKIKLYNTPNSKMALKDVTTLLAFLFINKEFVLERKVKLEETFCSIISQEKDEFLRDLDGIS